MQSCMYCVASTMTTLPTWTERQSPTYEVLSRYKEALEQGKAARTVTFETKDEQKIAHDLFLLTNKPVMYVCNVDDNSAVSGNKYVDMVREAVKDENAEILILAAKTGSERLTACSISKPTSPPDLRKYEHGPI